MSNLSTDLRRQRAYASRQRLLEAAEAQFRQYGFEDTTLESVAEVAGVHVQTLYRHFRKKSDLLAAVLEKNLAEFTTFMHQRQGDTLSAWRDWVELNAVRSGPDTSTHALPEMAGYWHRYEALLAREIAIDMGVNEGSDVRPMLAACMLVGTNKHRAHDLAMSGRTHNWVADLLEVVDVAIAQFKIALAAEAA